MRTFVERSTAAADGFRDVRDDEHLQWRRGLACSREGMDAYLSACESLSREEFFQVTLGFEPTGGGRLAAVETPIPSGFPDNDNTRVRLYPCRKSRRRALPSCYYIP